MMLYSTTSRGSFERIKKFVEQVKRIKNNENFSNIVIVGNKIDLEMNREVTTEEGKTLAKEYNFDFYETSAKTRINIDESIFQLVRNVRRKENLEKFYFTGNGIGNFFRFSVNTFDCEIPLFNKNLKNVWIEIFRFLFSNKYYYSNFLRLNLKLVCKYWYHLISSNFEVKNIQKEYYVGSSSLILVSSNFLPQNHHLMKKYIFMIDVCDYLKNYSTLSVIETLNKLNFANKKKSVLLVVFNTKLFKTIYDKNHTGNKEKNSKTVLSNILKSFSNFQLVQVDDLSQKNITTIFKKIDSKKYKKILQTIRLF